MSFNAVFPARTPDAEPDKDSCVLETPRYKLFAVPVRNQLQAVKECKKLAKEKDINSILLCPGFGHKAVAQISEAVGSTVAVTVARGDGPSSRIAAKALKAEGMIPDKE